MALDLFVEEKGLKANEDKVTTHIYLSESSNLQYE
jgi:hypothetical protein